MNEPTTLLLVDDHAVFLDLLTEHFDREPDLAVIGSTTCAKEAADLAAHLRPQVSVLDIEMPGTADLSLPRHVRACCPETRVLLLSAHCDDRYIEEALEMKIPGYVCKEASAEELLEAVRQVASGGVYFSDQVRARLVFGTDGPRLNGTPRTRRSLLSDRELEVLRHVALGLSNKEIAKALFISEKTVESHCDHLSGKLGIFGRVALTRYAIREGLVRA